MSLEKEVTEDEVSQVLGVDGSLLLCHDIFYWI